MALCVCSVCGVCSSKPPRSRSLAKSSVKNPRHQHFNKALSILTNHFWGTASVPTGYIIWKEFVGIIWCAASIINSNKTPAAQLNPISEAYGADLIRHNKTSWLRPRAQAGILLRQANRALTAEEGQAGEAEEEGGRE